MAVYTVKKLLPLPSQTTAATILSMVTMFILLMITSLNNAKALSVESTTDSADYNVVVDLSTAIDFGQPDHVVLTDTGALQPEINTELSQLGFEQADNDLVINMPFAATFEQRYIEGGQSKLFTHNQTFERNNGQVNGDVSVVNGRDIATTALYFRNNSTDTSTHSYVYSPLSGLNLLDIRNRGYSYSAWIKPSSLSGLQSIAASGPYHSLSNWLYLSDDKIAFQYNSDEGSGANVIGRTAIRPGKWAHVAGVYDPYSHTIRVYLNGQLEASTSLVDSGPFSSMTYALDLYVASAAGSKHEFTGSIADFKVFTRPLSDDYVKDSYAGQFYRGEIISAKIELPVVAGYNRLQLTLVESNPGSSQVSVWQNEQWQRLYPSAEAIFDMPAREPISQLQYKIEFNGQTELSQLSFTLLDKPYTLDQSKFSFMFMGDDNAPESANGPMAIADAFTRSDNLELIFSIPDNGFYPLAEFQRRYNQAILTAMSHKFLSDDMNSMMPFFIGLGNHDIENPDSVDHAVNFLAPRVPYALPGMTSYREGPFDRYENGATDQGLSYSFDYKNSHFVMLNGYYRDSALGQDRFAPDYTPISHVSEELLTWLEETLSYTNAQHKFIMFHEGAFPPPGARHRGDSLDSSTLPNNDGADNTRPMRDRLWTLLAKYNVTATLVGHNHTPSQSWIADPEGQYSAVYELEPGMLKKSSRYALVEVDNEQAVVKYIGTSNYQYDFKQTHDDVVINRNGSLANQAPKLFQHDAALEQGFPVIELAEVNLEVGQSLAGQTALYFEAKDQNINDILTFSYTDLPSFIQINPQPQFRRLYLTTSKLTTAAIGQYTFSVAVSDGELSDDVELIANVLAAEKPVILGSTVVDGSVLTKVKQLDFICHDNAGTMTGRTYNHFSVTANGQEMESSRWNGYVAQNSPQTLLEMIKFKDVDNLPFGHYQVTAFCFDELGLKSDDYVLNFELVDDGVAITDTVPWIRGVWPNAGRKYSSIERISIFPDSLTGGNQRALTEGTELTVEFSALDGTEVPYTQTNIYAGDSFGIIDVNMNQPLADGHYQLRVTPKFSRLSGQSYVYNYEVDSSQTDSQPPSPPASIQAQVLTASSVMINWSAATDDWRVSDYQLLRDGVLIATVNATSQHSYIDSLLMANTNYNYQVRAIDSANKQGLSLSASVVTLTADNATVPNAPSLLQIDDIQISWSDNADNEDGYRIERKLEGDPDYQLLAVLAANTGNYSDSSTVPGEKRCYRISAFNSAGLASANGICNENGDTDNILPDIITAPVIVAPEDNAPEDTIPEDLTIEASIIVNQVTRPLVIELAGRKYRSFADSSYGNQDAAVEDIAEAVFSVGNGSSKVRSSTDYLFNQDGVTVGSGYVSMSYNQANTVTIPLTGSGQAQSAKIYLKAGAWSTTAASFKVTAGDDVQVIELAKNYSWLSYEVTVNFSQNVDVIIQPMGEMGGYSHFYVAGVILDDFTDELPIFTPIIRAEITQTPGVIELDDVEFYTFSQGISGNEALFSSVMSEPVVTVNAGSLRSKISTQYQFMNNDVLVDSGYAYFKYHPDNSVNVALSANGTAQLTSIYLKVGTWTDDVASFTVTAAGSSQVIELPKNRSWLFYRIDIEFNQDINVSISPNSEFGGYSAFFVAGMTLKQLSIATVPTIPDPEPTEPVGDTVMTYYVDGSLSADCLSQYDVSSRHCGLGSARAYLRLATAAAQVQPGDQVLLRQGSYHDTLIPGQSGTAESPIYFGQYADEQVVISDVSGAILSQLPAGEHSDIAWEKFGFYLWNKSYITIDGLTIDQVNGWGRAVNSRHITLSNNVFTNAITQGSRGSIKFIMGGHNKIINNKIDSGNDNIFILNSDHNLIENNEITSGRHTLWTIKGGNYNVVRGNYFYNALEKIGEIFDTFDPVYGQDELHFGLSEKNATKYNLVEENIFAYTPASGSSAPYSGLQYAAQNGVIRNNTFYNITGPGIEIASYSEEAEFTTDNRIYNNVFYQNHFGGVRVSTNESHQLDNNVVKNNIFYNNDFVDNDGRFNSWAQLDGQFAQIITRPSSGAMFVNNAIFGNEQGDSYAVAQIFFNDDDSRGPEHYSVSQVEQQLPGIFTDNLDIAPDFIDPLNYDFKLAASSELIDRGAHLTRTISTGSGMIMNIEDAHYFYDSYDINGETGDTIQLESVDPLDTNVQTARILSIDYQQNTLVLDKPLQWSAGQGVSLLYAGSAPDVGAFEKQ